MIEQIDFNSIADCNRINRREYEQGYYDYARVKKNFYKVLNTLGTLEPNDLCSFITIRLKNRVGDIRTDWITANSVSKALCFKISAKYWGRKGRKHQKMPMVRSIEPNKTWSKEHLHILVRFKELKQYYSSEDIENFLSKTCYDFEEVNSRDKDAVRIRMFRYWNHTNELGNSIEYLCKTTTSKYNPLAI